MPARPWSVAGVADRRRQGSGGRGRGRGRSSWGRRASGAATFPDGDVAVIAAEISARGYVAIGVVVALARVTEAPCRVSRLRGTVEHLRPLPVFADDHRLVVAAHRLAA